VAEVVTQGDRRLTFVALSVSDLARSLAFYRDALGLPLADSSHDAERNDPWYGGAHAAYSWTDGAYLHFALYPARAPERPVATAAQIGFHVADFDRVHARVVGAGFRVVQEPRAEPWGRTARYLDPDGNIVSITARA
jgi:catechol 2,3-dioxygenase-like lactoylglutathione lyase family enzyme